MAAKWQSWDLNPGHLIPSPAPWAMRNPEAPCALRRNFRIHKRYLRASVTSCCDFLFPLNSFLHSPASAPIFSSIFIRVICPHYLESQIHLKKNENQQSLICLPSISPTLEGSVVFTLFIVSFHYLYPCL